MDTPNNLPEISSFGRTTGCIRNLLKVPDCFESVTDWNNFMENSKNNAFCIRYDGFFLKISKSFEKLLGYNPSELLSESIKKVIINPRYGYSGYIEFPTTNYYFNYCFKCKNGKIKLLRCRLVPGNNSDCIFVIAWEVDPV